MDRYPGNRQKQISTQISTMPTRKLQKPSQKTPIFFIFLVISLLLITILEIMFYPLLNDDSSSDEGSKAISRHTVMPTPTPFDPIDGVGGYVGDKADKSQEYSQWVSQDIKKYHNFSYGGFKLFYHIEAQTLMTPREVLALNPPPMVVTYGY